MQIKSLSPPRQREAVLVVLNADGSVDAFANDNVDVRVVNAIHCETAAGEVSAERLIEQSLPRRFLDVDFPGNRRAIGMVEKITVDDCWQRATEVDLCETLDRIRLVNEKKESVACLV